MPISKAVKKQLKEQFTERLGRANAAIVAEYKGLTVQDLTDLRVKLREAKAEFRIVKNRVAKVSIKEDHPEADALSVDLKGPVGVIFCYGDAAAAAKHILDFEKDRKELFKVKAGFMDGKALAPSDLKAIADLPSKDVLLARIIGTLVSPHRNILGILTAVPRQLVTVINAIKDKKSE